MSKSEDDLVEAVGMAIWIELYGPGMTAKRWTKFPYKRREIAAAKAAICIVKESEQNRPEVDSAGVCADVDSQM